MTDNRIKQIANHNGFKVICNKTFEELGELNTALARYQAEADTHYEGIVEDLAIHDEVRQELIGELADVIIMTKQLVYCLSMKKEVKQTVERKIQRQLQRMGIDLRTCHDCEYYKCYGFEKLCYHPTVRTKVPLETAQSCEYFKTKEGQK